MKSVATIFFILFQTIAYGNMANPVIEGSLGSRPFVNEFVDVVHEDLLITIDSSFTQAKFNVKYHINASKSGMQIPFLFYASEYLEAFQIKIDGIEVSTKDIPNNLEFDEVEKFNNFSAFYESKRKNNEAVMEESPRGGFVISLQDMIYFEADISKGEHIIEVDYTAEKWTDTWQQVNTYSFRYALSPAKYWRAFGTLHITVDASNFSGDLESNIGEPNQGDLGRTATWYFDELPTEILTISHQPKFSVFTEVIISLGANTFAFILGVLLIIVHISQIIKYRNNNLTKRYSIVVFSGNILVPFFVVVCWMGIKILITILLGDDEGGSNSYVGMGIILLPVFVIMYWIFTIVIDRSIKR